MTGPITEDPSALMQSLGDGRMIEFVAAENRAVMEFTGKPEMCHSGNVVQGGFVTAWIDSAMARAAMLATEGALAPVTLEIKVSFFRAPIPDRYARRDGSSGWVGRSPFSKDASRRPTATCLQWRPHRELVPTDLR